MVVKTTTRAICQRLIAYHEIVPDVPTWPLYTTDNPSNIVFNATGDTLDVHIEPDTWREKGMAIWAERPLEFDLAGSVKPWLVES